MFLCYLTRLKLCFAYYLSGPKVVFQTLDVKREELKLVITASLN